MLLRDLMQHRRCNVDVVTTMVLRQPAPWPALMELPPSPPPLHGHHRISLTPLPFPLLYLSQRLEFFCCGGFWWIWDCDDSFSSLDLVCLIIC
ncbi:hypothetical protein JHK86_037799 [Glycine max]|nr:hypothetical protein JHK86_037799 [Glycine max]